MSCKNCAEVYEEDGVEPDCWNAECLISAPDAWGQRILEIRERMITLKDLVDPGSILKFYNADLDDLELLSTIEAIVKEYSEKNGGSKD